MKELQERVALLERKIAEKEDELQLLKDDLEAVRTALEAAIEGAQPEPTSAPESIAIPDEEPIQKNETASAQPDVDEQLTPTEEEQIQEVTEDPSNDGAVPAEPDHEAIIRTIEQFANKHTTHADGLGAAFDKETVGERAASSNLQDIRKAMGLNERFLYANELFHGDMGAFTKAVEELNHLATLADAERMMEEELSIRYQWDDENETVGAFKTLISRRFT